MPMFVKDRGWLGEGLRVSPLCLLLAALLLSRWVAMAMIPLTDTSEARYAEIARLMAVSGDWITPWFREQVPFWGKPPLSFWAQALALTVLPGREFAPRFPAWLAHLGTVWLIGRYALALADRRRAMWAALIYSSMGLVYVCAGAVLTDGFFTLGTTASLVAAGFALRGQGRGWRWLFFIGLAIGLLAKGPLTLVLVGAPLMGWAFWSGRWRALMRALPWWRGGALMMLLSAPWYLAAELKTSGFLNYFIVGEHFNRFLDPGWAGDRYGSAHDQPRGTIWLLWVWAALPWSPVILWRLIQRLRRQREASAGWRPDDDQKLLLLAALVPVFFFTFSGNILATYVLPGLPFAALLLALGGGDVPARPFVWRALVVLMPVLALSGGVYVWRYPQALKTEKALIQCYRAMGASALQPLTYIGEAPFSARYYGHGRIAEMTPEKWLEHVENDPGGAHVLAVRKRLADSIRDRSPVPLTPRCEDRRFWLMSD